MVEATFVSVRPAGTPVFNAVSWDPWVMVDEATANFAPTLIYCFDPEFLPLAFAEMGFTDLLKSIRALGIEGVPTPPECLLPRLLQANQHPMFPADHHKTHPDDMVGDQ